MEPPVWKRAESKKYHLEIFILVKVFGVSDSRNKHKSKSIGGGTTNT